MNLWIGAASALTLLVAGPFPATAAGPAVPAVVHITNFHFVPPTLTVATGETVTFVNDDGEAHTVTAVDKSFDSTGLDEHDSWKHVFSVAGSFAYFCALHPYMKGTIVVRSTRAAN